MSLRWKLFRFLSTDTLLAPTVTKPSDFDAPLFPSLAASVSAASSLSIIPSTPAANPDQSPLLSRFATIADRSFQSHSYESLYAFALPRAVVHIFNLPALRLSATSAPPTSSTSTPALLPSLSPNHPKSQPSTSTSSSTSYNNQFPFPSQFSFSPHTNAVIAVHFVASSALIPLLVTLGLDDSGATLKVWSLCMRDASPSSKNTSRTFQVEPTSYPEDLAYAKCLATHRIQGDARPTTLAVTSSPQQPFTPSAAVGFHDGVVLLFTGDLTSSSITRVRVAPAPAEMIHVRAIVALHYTPPLLYVVSEASVSVISPPLPSSPLASPKSPSPAAASSPPSTRKITFVRTVLDNLGVPDRLLTCALPLTRELVVAKPEALYFFNRDGRGPCLAFPTEGSRPLITAVGNYIVHSAGTGTITAYDVVNKLIAYRGKGVATCAFVPHRPTNRMLLLCFSDGSIVKLSEIGLDERVSMLLKRGLHVPALALARSETATPASKDRPVNETLTNALRHYAEYLMSKERYDEAAEQLIETIGGSIEPSWVISRLVEQPGLRSGLRLYLEALHAAGKADFVHTKVLITCYRHDRARGAILGDKANEKTTDEYVINVFSDVDWSEEQVDAAIRLCRDAGLFKVAERVSRRRGRYVQLAETLIDDLKDVDATLSLLKSLSDGDSLGVILAVGRQLIANKPHAFVTYLAEAICQSTAAALPAGVEPVLKLDTFLPLFIDVPQWRAALLQTVLGKPGGIPGSEAPHAWLLLFESLVCVDLADRLFEKTLNSPYALATVSPSFIISGRTGPDNESKEASDEKLTKESGNRALKILQNRWSVIDLGGAVEIAEQYGHVGCLEYLYEHLRMYRELGLTLRAWGKTDSLVRACRRHGEREPTLWLEAIRLFTPIAAGLSRTQGPPMLADSPGRIAGAEQSEPELETLTDVAEYTERGSAQDVLDEAMAALERNGSISPLEIIETVVDACPSGKWGLVREYFERWCASLRRDAVNAEHSTLVLEGEFRDLEKEAARLSEETVVIKGRICSLCEDTLRLPVIHFLCGHSYHLSCLAASSVRTDSPNVSSGFIQNSVDGGPDNASAKSSQGLWGEDCLKCVQEVDAMVSMRQAIEDRNQKHDEFFAALKSSHDGFSTIIEFLERSPFL